MLLLDEKPLMILPGLAVKIGLPESIVIQQVHYWLMENMKKKHNFHDNRFWTFNTYEDWRTENFPFWSVDTIKRNFRALEKSGFLVVSNYNKKKYDRTKWYSIDYKKLDLSVPWDEIAQSMGADRPDGSRQIAPLEEVILTPPIPETNTETTTENTIKGPVGAEASDSKKVIEIFIKGNDMMKPGEKMHWKGGQFGKAIKEMLKLGDFELVRRKCWAYYQQMEPGSKYDQGFTPTAVLSQWHKLPAVLPKKKRAREPEMTEAEYEKAFALTAPPPGVE